MKSIKTYLKAIFLFSPGKPKEPFILEEPSKDEEQDSKKDSEQGHGGIYEHGAEKEDDIRRNKMKKESEDKEKGDIKEQEKRRSKENIPSRKPVIQPIPLEEKDNAHSDKKEDDDIGDIHASIKDCLEKIKSIYTADINGDFKIREFRIRVKGKIYSAFVCFFDGMIDRLLVNISILQPLMTLSTLPIDTEEQSVQEVIYNHLMPQNQIKTCKTYQEVVDEVNFGGIGIFIDSLGVAFSGDVKGWEHRTVDKPTSELNIRGPKEAFNETNRMNTALLRKTLKDENLIVEDVLIGTRSKTPCSIVYIKNLANSSLVDEVRRRMKSIKVGYLRIQANWSNCLRTVPFTSTADAPDRTARQGSLIPRRRQVGIIVHGSPYVIIAPVTLFNLIHSPEDSYLRYPYATLLRFIRIMGILFTLLLPSIYLAITNFHQEMLPTDLLLAIASSREKVPFPTIVSILIMELAFELIREAGIRIPGPIGTTLGIVGALILGQAAVSANLVSPILIIIVAVTGIGSFAIPDFSLGYSFRATASYIFYWRAYLAVGNRTGILFTCCFSPMHIPLGFFPRTLCPKDNGKAYKYHFQDPLWKEEDRPDFLNPKAVRKQPSSTEVVIKEKG